MRVCCSPMSRARVYHPRARSVNQFRPRALAEKERSPLPLLSLPYCHMGGRAFGPPLCRGCAPATPPYKTIPHRPCLLFPSIVSGERSLLPLRCLIPLTPAVPPQFPCSSAPPQRPPRLATVFTLPQHRVWRTESAPPLLSHPPNPCSSPAVPLQFRAPAMPRRQGHHVTSRAPTPKKSS